MPDQIVQVAVDGAGKKIDTSELTVGANSVERQRVNISDPTTAAAHAGVTNALPGAADYGLEVRPIGADTSATLSLTATATIGTTGNTTGTQQISLAGQSGFAVNLAGTFTATVAVETSTDGGTTWFAAYVQRFDTPIVVPGTGMTNAFVGVPLLGVYLSGCSHARVRCTAFTSGTVQGTIRATSVTTTGFPFAAPTGYLALASVQIGGNDGGATRTIAALNSQPVGTEYGLAIRPVSSFPDVTVGATTINGSGQTIQIAFSGQVGASFQLTGGGSLVCTITPQLSIDGGTNWFNTIMEIPGTGQIISTANIANLQGYTQWTVIPAAGASHARLLVTSYTVGTATFTARAAQIVDSADEDAGPPGSLMPPIVGAQGAKDPSGFIQALQTSTLLPTGSEQGLIIRPAGGPPDLSTAPANFTSANNGTSFAIPGYTGVSLNITGSAATFVFKAQVSTDGGTTWTDTYMQTVAGVTAATFGANGQYAVILLTGTSHVRVVLNSITSGTFTYQYRASMATDMMQTGTAKTALPTTVSDGILTTPLYDKWGRQAVTSLPIDLLTGAQVNPTTAATTQVLAAGGAGVRYGIVHIHVSNAGTLNQQVDIKDGGTVVWSTFAAASGGGAEADYSNTPILCTAATALNATTSAASSTFIRVDVAQLA